MAPEFPYYCEDPMKTTRSVVDNSDFQYCRETPTVIAWKLMHKLDKQVAMF